MGLFRQFLQLLWKNLILRKRQKHVLLLEVVWPVFIFLVVIIIRQGTPPVKKDTCSYNEHAMPSAGLVPFLQSTVCNLQNPCEARSSIEIKQNNMNSFAAAIQDLTPHFSSEPTLKALKSVKTGMKLANAISDISKNGSLSNLMNDTSFQLKKFFRDPDKMKDIFVNDLGVMTSDVADALLNAELNIPEVLHNIGSIDFRDIVCDQDRLMEYMMFRIEANMTSVSRSLCAIPESRIPEITNVVQNQIDVAAIIRVSKTLTALTMDYTLTDALEDIATMTDLLYGTSNFMSIIRDLPDLKDLPDIMHKIPGLVESVIRLGVTDLSWMTDLVKFLDPIIDRIDPDNVGWNVTKEIVGVVLDVSSIANGKAINMTDLVGKQKEVMEMLESRNMSLDWLSTVPNVNLDNAVNAMSALFSGNLTGLNETTILLGMNELQNFTEMIIGNNSQFIMDSIDGTMDILATVMDVMLELEKSLNSTFVYNQDIMDAFTTLITNGPNLTKSVVMEFIEPHNLLAIVNNTKDYPAICKQIVEKIMSSEKSHAHISKLENSLCSHKIAKSIETNIQLWEEVFNKQIQPMIDNVVNGTIRRVEMATIYQKAKALVSGVEELYGRGSVWESMIRRMGFPTINPMAEEWQTFFRDTQTYLIQGSWPVVVVKTGQYLENSQMWNTIGPIAKSISLVMQDQVDKNRKLEELTGENSTMMTLMKFVVNYSPEIATAAMKMTQNATMIQTIATQGFTLESFCDNHMLQEMGMPSYVPVDTVENKICTTNWTAMMTKVVSIVDTSSMSAEITKYMTDKSTSTNVDWDQMVYNIQSMVSMEQNSVSYMIESMMSFNFSKLSETVDVMLKQITEPTMMSNVASNMSMMSVQNLMSLGAGFVPTLQQLDVQLENVTEWKMVKYYINVWNSISKMALEFLQDSMSDLDKYLMDLSPTFADFLNTVNSSAPSLFKALEKATLHPGVLLQKLLTTNLAEVCHGVRVWDLLDSPALAPYETHLCQVDWTQVYREVLDNTGLSAIFNDTMETAIHENIYVNWNETYYQTEQLFEEVWGILSHPSNLTSALDKFYNIQLGKTNMTWESLLSLYNTTQHMDLTKLAELANQIPAVLEMLNKLTGNSSAISSLLGMQSQFLYQTYSIQQFIINQLQYFNDTTHVTLSVYLNSPELDRLFNQLSDSPAMSGVLYRIIVNVVFDPSKMTNLTKSADRFCADPGFLTPFVSPSDVQSAEKLRNYMCDTINMNVTVLLHELSQTHGFTQLMESLEKTDNFPAINMSSITEQSEKLTKLITDLITHPPTISLTDNEAWLNGTLYTQEFTDFLQRLTDKTTTTDIIQNGQLAELSNLIPAIFEMINKMTGNSSEFYSLIAMQSQLTYQTYSINKFLIKQLRYFNDSTHVTLTTYFSSPELTRLLNQISDSPGMSGVLFRTLVNIMYDAQKTQYLTNNAEKFCTESGVLTPVVDPSDVQKAEKLRNYVCDTLNMNVSALWQQLSEGHGISQLIEALEKTDGFPSINMTLITEQSMEMSKLITDLISHPPTISLTDNEAWLNGTLYTQEFTDFLQRLTDKTTTTDIIQNGQLAELSNMIPAVLEMINKMTGNTSEFSSLIAMQSQLTFQTYSINKFIIKQLQYFNDSTHITITKFLSSPELTRLLNQISDSPEMSGVLFRTLVNIMYDAEKTQYLTNNAEKFCTESGVLTPVVDPSDVQKAEKLRNYVCDTLNMNVTALWQQLSEGHGIPQLVEALEKTDGFPSINMSVITEQSMEMSKLITDLISHPPTISLTDNEAWLNGTLYTQEFTDFLQKLTDKTTTTDIVQSLMTASYQKPIIDAITAPLANVTEFQTIVQVTDWFLTELKDKILTGSSDAMKDIIAEFKGYPQMERLLNLLDQLPSFYQTLLYNIVHHMEKLPEMFTAVSKGWAGFCNQTDTLIYDDPSQTFSAKAFLGELCLLDFDEMMNEVSRFQVSNKSAASSLNASAGLEDIIQKVEDIVKMMNTSAVDNLPKFMQLEVWNNASSTLVKSLTDPQMMSTWISGGLSSLTSTLTMIDGGKQLLQVFDAAFTLTKAVWTRFSSQKNESVLDLLELLNGADNTQKLWNLIQQPGSIEVLIHSANTPQFNQLVQKNLTEALLDLCAPSRGKFTQIFTAPAGVRANITDLQNRLCAVNITQLTTEWENIIDLHTVKLMVDPSHQPSLNWTEVTLFFDEMTRTISEWTVHPPLVTGYPSRWSNESYWLNLLMQQPASSGSLTNITTQLKSILDAMSPFLDQEPIKTYGLFLEKLLNLTNRELDVMAGGNFTNLQDLVHYVPALEKLMLALNLSEDTAEQLMMAPIKNPSELVKMLISDQPLDMLCSVEFWQRLVSWTNSSSPVSSILCHLNETDVIKVIIDSLKVSDLVKILENGTSTEKPNWMNIVDEVMHMVKSVEGLISNSSFSLNIDGAFDNVMKAYSTQNNVDDFSALFKVYGELALMFNNTEVWQKVNEFLQTGEVLMTSAVRFMDRLVSLDPNDITGMILGLMKPYKISDLFTKDMDLWGVYNLTCNTTAWRELFHFAPTTNITALTNLACFMNQKEATQFITTLLMRNQSLSPVDIQQFLKTVEKFNNKFAMFLNGSSNMAEINMTAFQRQLEQELAILPQTTSPIMMESLEKYFAAMNSSDWGKVTAVVNGMTLWLKMLAAKLENIADQPLSLSVILGGASTDPAVKFILSNEFLNSIGDIKVNPQKLSSALQNMTDSGHVCQAILQSLSTPANNATMLHLQNLLCSLNQSSVLEAAMTGFLANHQFAKQFQAVIDESKSGQFALNMSAYSQAATEFNTAILRLVMRNWTGQSLDNIFNMSALLNSIQRLEQSFQNEMNENLLKMAPVLLQSTLGAVPDPAVAKTVMSVNMFLKFANDKLRFLKGSLGISNVFQNSSALIDYFNAVQKLTNNGIQEVQKMNFTQLIDSLMNVGSIENHCTHGTIGPYFGLTPDSPWIPILCADYDQLLSSLDNLTDSSSISKQLMNIWNASSTVVVDWSALSNNMDTFSSLLTELVRTPPTFSLTALLDTNHTMNIISQYINNPQRIVEFMLQTSIMDKLPPIPETFRGMFNVITEMLAFLNDTQNVKGLADIFKTWSSLNTRYELASSRFNKLVILLEDPQKMREFSDVFCNPGILLQLQNYFPTNAMTVSDILCTKSVDSWYNELQKISMPQDVFTNYILAIYYTERSVELIPDPAPIAWSEMLNEVKKVMTALTSGNQRDWETFLTQQTSVNDTIQQIMDWLKFFEQEFHMGIGEFFSVFVPVSNMFNKQIDRVKGLGHNISLSAFLPVNNTELASLIGDEINHPSAAILVSAVVAPDMLMNLIGNGLWNETMCDLTKFQSTFTFPAETDVKKLQADLCKDMQEPGSFINKLMEDLNVKDIAKIADSYTPVEWQNAVIKLVDNIMYLQKVEVRDDLSAWIRPVMDVFSTNLMSTVDLEGTCNNLVMYASDSMSYRREVEPILTAVRTNLQSTKIQLQLQLELEDFMCDISSMNMSSLLRNLESKNISQQIQEYISVMTLQNSSRFECHSLFTTLKEITELFERMVNQTYLDGARTMQCLEQITMLPSKLFSGDFMESIKSISRLMVDGMSVLNQPFMQNNEVLKMITSVFQKLATEDLTSAGVLVSNLLSSNSTMAEKLQDILNLAPEAASVFLNATIKPEFISLLVNNSEEAAAIFCNPDRLEKYVELPGELMNSVQNVSAVLCGTDPGQAANTAKIIGDLLGATAKIVNTQDFGSPSWWNHISGDITDIIGKVQKLGLFNLTSIDLDSVDMKTVLPYIQELIYRNGPDALADSLVELLDDFKPIMNDTFMISVTSDIEVIIRGLTSLKAIRNFIPRTVLIRTVLKDPATFHDYLTNNLTLSDDDATAIIEGTINYASLMSLRVEDFGDYVCNVTSLDKLLNVTSTKVSTSDVSKSLCGIGEDKVVSFVESMLQNMDLGKLVQQYVSMSSGKFLEHAQLTPSEVQDAVKSMSDSSSELNDLANLFNNKSSQLGLSMGTFDALHGSGPSSVSSLYDMICGTGKSTAIKDTTGVSSISAKTTQSQPTTHLTPDQQAEQQTLPGEFCQDMYETIIQMSHGPVIWSYLKPLIMGKILYSPDTPATRSMIEKMYNSSFKVLAEVKDLAEQWSNGTQDLGEFLSNTAAIAMVKSLDGNNFLNNLLESTLQVSSSDVMNGFYTLDSLSSNQVLNISQFFRLLANYTQCVSTDRFVPMSTERQMELMAIQLHQNNTYLAGIAFQMETTGRKKRQTTSDSIPKHVIYKIKMDIENVESTRRLKEKFWRPYPEDDMFLEMRYFRGFIQLQDMLDRAIINLQTGSDVNNTVFLQQFPTPCYVNDKYMELLSSYLLPIMMTIAWLAAISVATKNLVYDRENGQEEALKIMGLNSVMTWWVWFLSTMLMMTIISLICLLVLRVGGLFTYTNFGIIILYFLAFCFSSTMLCYMVGAFFTQATLAILFVIIIYLLSYLPYIVLIAMSAEMEFWQQILACLSSTTAFGFGSQYLAHYEIQMIGIHWDNMDSSPIEGDQMNFHWCLIMMALDGVIYLLIGWYIRGVKPGKYGVPEPWYFPLSPYYWGCIKSTVKSADKYRTSSGTGALLEEYSKDRKVGMSLRHLSKKFGNQEVVKDLNCDFFEGQITVLLGHNGAAKSTTLNMMCGILQPTHGKVSIYGHRARHGAKKIGICPQYNALFHYMTVREHLEFYSAIKSDASKSKMKKEIDSLLHDVDLWNVQDTLVSTLSGGMQRRLCVALAFAGDSKAVILDEPTSGVDPSARRSIWNLLVKRKMRCTILLSTHFLDEADTIGDRIAVMHKGQILCTGSPMFLKEKVGSGYHLRFAKADTCNTNEVLAMVRNFTPEAEIVTELGSEVIMSLPFSSDQSNQFFKCLYNLDKGASSLGVNNYGVYDTTLEEVFQKVCSVADKDMTLTEEVLLECRQKPKMEDPEKEEAEDQTSQSSASYSMHFSGDKRKGLIGHKLGQFSGMLIKRFHHYRRDWRMFLSVFLLPLVFMTASLGLMELQPQIGNAPAKILTPPLYGPRSHTFVKDNVNSDMTRYMIDSMKSRPGFGTTCMKNTNFGPPFECVNPDPGFSTVTSGQKYDNCTCENNKYVCSHRTMYQDVPHMTTRTTTQLYNLQDKDIDQYLLQTSQRFLWNRFGGLSFDPVSGDPMTMKSTVWFNNKGRHALPSFYNALSNTMLRATLSDAGVTDTESFGITAINEPILLHEQQLTIDTLTKKASDVGIGLFMLVAFSFIPVGFTMYVLNELLKKEKQLLFLSGTGPLLYWFTAILWDMLMYCLTVALTVAIMAIFQNPVYWERSNLQASVLLVIMYGWASIPLMYSMMKLFRDTSTAYMVLFCGSVFIGITTACCTFLLEYFSDSEKIQHAFEILSYVFLVFPQFSYVNGFLKLTTNQLRTEILSLFSQDAYVDPFSFDMLAWNFIAMGIQGAVFFIITLLTEFSCHCSNRVPHSLHSEEEKEDEDVSAERARVQGSTTSGNSVTVSNLSKVYGRGGHDFLAVNQLCFGVKKGECFGLLGVNGAGKTTTFRMLTGDIQASSGAAFIKNHRIVYGESSLGRDIGYCPQEEALDRYLTGGEMLHFYARMRGLPNSYRNYSVQDLIQRLKLTSFVDKPVHTYSGGMKRKLSVAIALLGEPNVVFLDEPTTGMDPTAKRQVWNCVLAAIKNGQSVVMTSHSMEECDAICTRLAIMVNGSFQCIGSSQHLKDKFGSGHTVTISQCGLPSERQELMNFLEARFPGVIFRVQHQGVLEVQVPSDHTSVADVIQVLDELKCRGVIQNYSVSQTTLDDVFLSFTREQTDGVGADGEDSYTDFSSDASENVSQISSSIAKNQFAYMNPGYAGDKGEKMGQLSAVFINPEEEFTPL